jgi:hypothetical protein
MGGGTPNSQRLGGAWGGNIPLLNILYISKKNKKKNKIKILKIPYFKVYTFIN